MTEQNTEKVGRREEAMRLLEPHWRTDCSESEPHAYVRWVRCRCGWESRRSSSLVNAPDLHRIWIGHLLDALSIPSAAHACRCDGGSYEVVAHPFLVHPDCPIHGSNNTPSAEAVADQQNTEKARPHASAPAVEDLIADLRAYHTRTDPDNRYGFNSAEIWEYRLQAFGYLNVFSSWYQSVWVPSSSTSVTSDDG